MYRNFSTRPAANSATPRFAGHQYHQIDTGSRVDGATPHALVTIMFEEVLMAIDTSISAARAQDRILLSDQRYRALSILVALESSLDFRAGGDLAVSLARVYREASRLLRTTQDETHVAQLTKARAMIGDIADAWFVIGAG